MASRHRRLTNSPARTNLALLIRRAVRLAQRPLSEECSLDAASGSHASHPSPFTWIEGDGKAEVLVLND
jgi:hypothetical protein